MELLPLLPFWRHVRNGAAAGFVVALGFTAWRVTREGRVGWTALGLLGGALVLGLILSLYFRRWVPKQWRKAEPMPADATVMQRGKVKWWALLGGAAYGVAAVGRAGDDSVILSGVMTGLVAGALVAFTLAVARLRREQDTHGQELLQLRRGGFRNPCHYLRPLDGPRTGRFDRGRAPEPALTE